MAVLAAATAAAAADLSAAVLTMMSFSTCGAQRHTLLGYYGTGGQTRGLGQGDDNSSTPYGLTGWGSHEQLGRGTQLKDSRTQGALGELILTLMRTQSCRSDTLWRKVVRWLLHNCYTGVEEAK